MLKIIRPKNQKSHKATIEYFLGLLKIHQNIELPIAQQKKATFIIAEDEKWGIYGGAVLYSQNVCSESEHICKDMHEDTFSKAFTTFHPEEQKLWMTRICFCLADPSSPFTVEGVELCESFYRDLYKAFIEAGEQNEIEFLCFTISAHEPFDLPFYKGWPHNLPVSHSPCFDHLCHGILSLKGTKFFPKISRKSKLKRTPANMNKSEPSSEKERVQ